LIDNVELFTAKNARKNRKERQEKN